MLARLGVCWYPGGITLARFPCPCVERLRKRYGGHCSPVKALQFIDSGNRAVSCSAGDCCIVQWKIVQEAQVLEIRKEKKVPAVVLHGDVSAKSADMCDICRRIKCTDSTHDIPEKSKALRKSVAAGGSYRGERDEAEESEGTPQVCQCRLYSYFCARSGAADLTLLAFPSYLWNQRCLKRLGGQAKIRHPCPWK